MQGLLSLFIFTMLLKSIYGQLLYDSFGERQKCVNVGTHIKNNELRQITKSMERMVKQNMEGVKNLDASVRNMNRSPEIGGVPERSNRRCYKHNRK